MNEKSIKTGSMSSIADEKTIRQNTPLIIMYAGLTQGVVLALIGPFYSLPSDNAIHPKH